MPCQHLRASESLHRPSKQRAVKQLFMWMQPVWQQGAHRAQPPAEETITLLAETTAVLLAEAGAARISPNIGCGQSCSRAGGTAVCFPKTPTTTLPFHRNSKMPCEQMRCLTGPLLFREMFFHRRRWSWCRNPILPDTSTSLCLTVLNLTNEQPGGGLRLDLENGDFYPASGHLVTACHRCVRFS